MGRNPALYLTRSVLGPLLINVFFSDFQITNDDGDLHNVRDNNTLYKCCNSLDEAKSLIESQCSITTTWLRANALKPNPKKLPWYYTG